MYNFQNIYNNTNTTVFIPEIYQLAPLGTMKCPDGWTLVIDVNDCRRSATIFGRNFASVGCFETEVPGCLDNGVQIWFSTCVKSQPLHHSGVCTGKYVTVYI